MVERLEGILVLSFTSHEGDGVDDDDDVLAPFW